jgi:hypothetical protein
MIIKAKTGIYSCIGLLTTNIINGFLLVPSLKLSNLQIQMIIISFAYLFFTISLWICMRFFLVIEYKIASLKKYLNWLIVNLSFLYGIKIIYILFSTKEIYLISIIVFIIISLNYLLVWWKIYLLDTYDIRHVKYLHGYVYSILSIFVISLFSHLFNKVYWHKDFEFAYEFMNFVPNIFLLIFFLKLKQDTINKKIASA